MRANAMKTFKAVVPVWLKKKYWSRAEDQRLMRKYGVRSPKHAHELDYWQ